MAKEELQHLSLKNSVGALSCIRAETSATKQDVGFPLIMLCDAHTTQRSSYMR